MNVKIRKIRDRTCKIFSSRCYQIVISVGLNQKYVDLLKLKLVTLFERKDELLFPLRLFSNPPTEKCNVVTHNNLHTLYHLFFDIKLDCRRSRSIFHQKHPYDDLQRKCSTFEAEFENTVTSIKIIIGGFSIFTLLLLLAR